MLGSGESCWQRAASASVASILTWSWWQKIVIMPRYPSFIPSVTDWMELLKEGDIFLEDKWKQDFRISIMKHDFLESRLGELFASVTWKSVCNFFHAIWWIVEYFLECWHHCFHNLPILCHLGEAYQLEISGTVPWKLLHLKYSCLLICLLSVRPFHWNWNSLIQLEIPWVNPPC